MPHPQQLTEAWDKAFATGEPIDVGDIVVCDVCNDDYTARDDVGGFIHGSYAHCPPCAARHEPGIVEFGEAHLIRARAAADEPFRAFVLRMRAGNNTLRVRRLSIEDL